MFVKGANSLFIAVALLRPKPEGVIVAVSMRSLVAALLALLMFAFGGIIWTNRTAANAEIISSMQSILSNVSSSTTARSQDFLTDARASSEIAAVALTQKAMESSEDLESYFGSVLKATPSANGVFFGTIDGDFVYVSRSSADDGSVFRTKLITVDGGDRVVELIDRDIDFKVIKTATDPEDTYDPRVRPWFQSAIQQNKTVLTDPYVFFTSQLPGITAASPVYEADGTVSGIVGVDVELSALSSFLKDLSLGENGSAFIFNARGEIIALDELEETGQPDGDGFRLSSVDEVGSTVLTMSFDASADLGSRPETFTISDGDSKLHAFVAPIAQTDWILGVSLDEADFLGDVRSEQQRSNLVALALGLIGIGVGWRLIQNVTVPLTELRKRAQDIEAGSLIESEPSTSVIKELRATSDAFDHMVGGLLSQRENESTRLAGLKGTAADQTIDLDRELSDETPPG